MLWIVLGLLGGMLLTSVGRSALSSLLTGLGWIIKVAIVEFIVVATILGLFFWASWHMLMAVFHVMGL